MRRIVCRFFVPRTIRSESGDRYVFVRSWIMFCYGSYLWLGIEYTVDALTILHIDDKPIRTSLPCAARLRGVVTNPKSCSPPHRIVPAHRCKSVTQRPANRSGWTVYHVRHEVRGIVGTAVGCVRDGRNLLRGRVCCNRYAVDAFADALEPQG